MARIKEKYRVYLDPNFTRQHLASGRRSAIDATLGRYQRLVDPYNLVIEASVFKLRNDILMADISSLIANETTLKLEGQQTWNVGVDSDGRLLVDSPFLPPDAPRPVTTAATGSLSLW